MELRDFYLVGGPCHAAQVRLPADVFRLELEELVPSGADGAYPAGTVIHEYRRVPGLPEPVLFQYVETRPAFAVIYAG